VGLIVTAAVYFFVILVDNTFARLKWPAAIKSAWIVTLVLGFGNILVLSALR
jgi:NADH:ubiquinone oxidoreductase subunit H